MILLPWLEAFPGKILQLNFPHQLRFREEFSATWGLGVCNPLLCSLDVPQVGNSQAGSALCIPLGRQGQSPSTALPS